MAALEPRKVPDLVSIALSIAGSTPPLDIASSDIARPDIARPDISPTF